VLKSNSDDNRELRNCLSGLLLYYNADHRGADFTLCAGMATGYFETMLRVVRPLAALVKRRIEELSLEASKRPRPSAAILESTDEYHTGTVRSNVGMRTSIDEARLNANSARVGATPVPTGDEDTDFVNAVKANMERHYRFTGDKKDVVVLKDFLKNVFHPRLAPCYIDLLPPKAFFDKFVEMGVFGECVPTFHEALRIGGNKERNCISGLKSIDVATFAGQLDTALKKEAGSTKYSVEQVKRLTGENPLRSRGCIFGWRHHTEAMDESDSTTSQHME
jgi:hypothetical protein